MGLQCNDDSIREKLPAIGGPANEATGIIANIIVISSWQIPILNPCNTRYGVCKLLAS